MASSASTTCSTQCQADPSHDELQNIVTPDDGQCQRSIIAAADIFGADPSHEDGYLPPPPVELSSCSEDQASMTLSPRSSSYLHDYIQQTATLNLAFLHGSDPVKEEINRLENQLRDKDRALARAHAEVKALQVTERCREKALEELADELARVDRRLQRAELLIENKNLELKRLNDEKKAAQAGQQCAESALRRLQLAAQKDELEEDALRPPPLEAILAPLDAEIRLARQEVARLQEDNRALERLSKAKETALLEAQRAVEMASARASIVQDVQNRNQELAKRIDSSEEENKILDKMHRQKVVEVEKLSLRTRELEEMLLCTRSTAENVAREYQRQLEQSKEEKKGLERELARAKITANRVTVTNGSINHDHHEGQLMPVRQWLQERRALQSEMMRLREKLLLTEKASRAEAILKEKAQSRLKVLEEISFMQPAVVCGGCRSRVHVCGPSVSDESHMDDDDDSGSRRAGLIPATPLVDTRRRSDIVISCTSSTVIRGNYVQAVDAAKQPAKSTVRRASSGMLQLQTITDHEQDATDPKSRPVGGRGGPADFETLHDPKPGGDDQAALLIIDAQLHHDHIESEKGMIKDLVSGHLYDVLQKQVILLRKTCEQKDRELTERENVIEMLQKKVSSLGRYTEAESKKLRRKIGLLEKELALRHGTS